MTERRPGQLDPYKFDPAAGAQAQLEEEPEALEPEPSDETPKRSEAHDDRDSG